MSHAVSPFWGQVPDVILSTILVIGIGTDNKRLQHTISMQTVGGDTQKGRALSFGVAVVSRCCLTLSVSIPQFDSLKERGRIPTL